MEQSLGHDGLPPRMVGHRADGVSVTVPVGAAAVLRGLGVAGYGRHAAPASAYGPSDIHRLLPAAPPARRPERPGAEGTPAAAPVRALRDEADGGYDGGSGSGSSDESPTRTTGFLARLRLLPRAA